MATAPISYGSDYSADAAAIERNRKYAQMIQEQSLQPIEQQTAGGWVIPTGGLSVLTKGLQGLGAGYMSRQADQKEKDIATRYKQDLARVLAEGGRAQSGTPAMPANNDVMQSAQSLDSFDGNPAKAAVPGDPNAAAAIYMQHPATQQMGLQLMQKEAENASRARLLAKALGSPQGGVPGAPGGAPNLMSLPPQIQALMTSGDPELVKLGTTMLEANKGIAQRPGAPVVNPITGAVIAQPTPAMAPGMQLNMSPQGNTAAPVPGYAAGAADIAGQSAGAVSGAQARNKLIKVDTPQGPRLMTEAQAAQMASGGQAPQTPWVGREPRGAFEGDPALIAANIDAIKDPQERAAAARAFNNQLSGTQGGAPQPAAPRGGGIALQSDEVKAYGQERAKDFAKQATTFAEQGARATGMLRQIGELETLYKDPNIAKGAIAENISGLKNLASSFGVDIKGLGGEQAVTAITNKMALELRNAGEGGGMPGAMSDPDRNFLVGMTPNLAKSPEGRQKIMGAMRKVSERQAEIARMATAYEQKNGQLDVGFQRQVQEYANANPLFKAAPSAAPNIDAILAKPEYR